MRLTLRLSPDGPNPNGVPREKVLETGQLVIGRGTDCGWTLPDPEKVISRKHCIIEVSDGRCVLTDTSSSGTYINGSGTAIGRDKSVDLHDGDRLALARYEVMVEIGAPAAAVSASAGWSPDREPIGSGLQSKSPFDDEAPSGPIIPPDASIIPGRASSGKAKIIPDGSMNPFTSGARQRIPTQESGSVQDSGSGIHEQILVPRTQRPIEASEPPHRPEAKESTPNRSGERVGGDALARAFRDGLGGGEAGVGANLDAAAMRQAGALLRQLVAGLHMALQQRATIMNEIQVARTQIKLDGNNPVKFSVSPDEALAHLLAPRKKGYLPAEKAVEEAFHDLSAHLIATMAGQQAALKALIAEFSPENLKGRLQEGGVLAGLVPGARKARYWDLYESMFGKIASDAEETVHGRYALEFRREYERQIRDLRSR